MNQNLSRMTSKNDLIIIAERTSKRWFNGCPTSRNDIRRIRSSWINLKLEQLQDVMG